MSGYGEADAVLGVVGGMGPLASAEFVRSIYRLSGCRREQDMPRVLLDSDAGFPDRTTAIRAGRSLEITRRLEDRLGGLLDLGATRVVIVCLTAHHFLPMVAPALRTRLVSLVDVTVEELRRRDGRFLMLCTEGTARARIFQEAVGWSSVADRVRFPACEDQALIHRMIYQMKIHGPAPSVLRSVAELRDRYRCTGVVGGCTEFHLVSGELVAQCGQAWVVDALLTIATDPVRVGPTVPTR